MAKPKTDDAYGIVLTAHGLAAVLAGLEALLMHEGQDMSTAEVEFVENLMRDIRKEYANA